MKILFISNITNKITNLSYISYIVCKNLGIEFCFTSNLDNFNFEQNKYKDIIFYNIDSDISCIAKKIENIYKINFMGR